MDFGITHLLGLLSLLVLIPFIIIYLIRPKSVKLEIPSLMFFAKSNPNKITISFFKKLLRNLLFLIQLIVLLLLALSLIDPWLSFEEISSSKSTVLVIDVSASMQAGDRFNDVIAQAMKLLGSKNTIILAGSEPIIALDKVSKYEAKSFLKSLSVTDSESNIGDAIILAGEILKDGDGRVIVFSDFIQTKGMIPLTAKNVLESKGIPVNFVSVSSEDQINIGIVNVNVEEQKSTLFIKNYHLLDIDTQLKVNDKLYDLKLSARNIKPIAVENGDGITKVEILYDDDFLVDNKAFISIPSGNEVNVLIVTNKDPKFLRSALEAAGNIKVDVVDPLVLPSLGDYDVYIFMDIDRSKFLVGTLDEIIDRVDKGKSLIFVAQKDMMDLDGYARLLPVKVAELKQNGNVQVALVSKFTKDVDFGVAKNYFRTENKQGSVTSVAVVENSTIIALAKKGEGRVVYYGLIDSESDFKLSTSYPVFWVKLVQYLAGRPGLEDMNLDVGEKLYLPDGDILTFNNVGVYKKGNVEYAVNLANEKESDINAKKSEGQILEGYNFGRFKEEVVHSYEWRLILIAFIFVIIEVVYLKWRGEL